MKKIIAISLSAALMTSGCASFKANNLPVVDQSKMMVKNTNKTKVFSRWSIVSDDASVSEQLKSAGAAVHKSYFETAIKESDCCILVEGPTEADIIVDGKAFNENNAAALIPAFITGLSLYTIPSWVTAKIHIEVKAESGSLKKTYDLSDSFTLVQWLPMIFALPFTGGPIENGKAVDLNTYRNLVVNMTSDGYFSKK